jgi:hypothetical protein
LSHEAIIIEKLRNVFGEDKARSIFSDILTKSGLANLRSPNDELLFGDTAIKQGGLFAVIGRSITINAILRGAKRST